MSRRPGKPSSSSGNSEGEEEDTTAAPSIKMESPSSEELNVAEIVLSNKGGPKVIHNGYMYTLHKKQPHNIRWRCVGRTLHCRGSLITTTDCKKPRVRMEHNHNPDYAAVQLARKRYIALGQPRILPEDEDPAMRLPHSSSRNHSDFFTLSDWQSQPQPQPEPRPSPQPQPRRQVRPILQKILPAPSQAGSSGKTIRIGGQSLIRQQMRNIAPAPLPSQQQQQQQLQHPKTLVLKTIPLKVKQVAPTTIKMPPRQIPQGSPQAVLQQQPTEVCLRWNSYHSNMQNSFPSLLDAEQFVDVTLACEGRSLKCHKMILSSCSDYLAELLRENPCQHPIILMKDLKFWEVEALVKFMYRGEVNVAHDKLPQLLNAAEALQIKGLAGPSPSSQNAKPPMLIPQLKPTASHPIISRITSEAKETKSPMSNVPSPLSPKRGQKRCQSESTEPKTFTKIRLQRPATPPSPSPAVKLEPLDIPLSPTEMFADNNEDCSTTSNFGNLVGLHEDDDPGGDEPSSVDGDLNFCELPGPSDLNDSEDQMEFVPTDFLEQEQDILEEHEPDPNNKEEPQDHSHGEDDDYDVEGQEEFSKKDNLT